MLKTTNVRYPEIDAARGLFVLMMILFHAWFDLTWLRIIQPTSSQFFWQIWGRSTAIGFLSLVGISLSIWYQQVTTTSDHQAMLPLVIKRARPILLWAAVITIVTWLIEPSLTVWFGILHLITCLVVSSAFWLRWTSRQVILAVIIIGLASVLVDVPTDAYWGIPLGIIPRNFTSFDFYPIIPWSAVVLVGALIGRYLYMAEAPGWLEKIRVGASSSSLRGVRWLGQHALSIYVLHQPVLFISFWLLDQTLKKLVA